MSLESVQIAEIQGNPETLALLASLRRQLEMACGPGSEAFIDSKVAEYEAVLADRDAKFAQIHEETRDDTLALQFETERSRIFAQTETGLALAGLAAAGKERQFRDAFTQDIQGSGAELATA